MRSLFFATDLHGSETCWRKFLNAARFYEVDVLICGGDITGKALVPIVERPGGFEIWNGQGDPFASSDAEPVAGWISRPGSLAIVPREALETKEKSMRRAGYYPMGVTAEELKQMVASPDLVRAAFRKQMLGTLERWLEVAEVKLRGTGIRCIACPGNDDTFDLDGLLANSSVVELGEGCNIDLGGCELISTGWVNPTPWNTYREEPEDELRLRIDSMVRTLRDPSRAIFNFHAPPFRSGLDDAPALNRNLRMQYGGAAIHPVGSTAVRDVIWVVRPSLSLHGHVHEAWGSRRLGRTLAINPGSSYDHGILRGAIVRLDPRRGVSSYQLVEG